MNIKDILEAAGYEVLEESITRESSSSSLSSWRFLYKIRYSHKKIESAKLKPEYQIYYSDEIYDVFDVVVTNVGFNGFGGFYIDVCLENDEDEVWDYIELQDGKVSSLN